MRPTIDDTLMSIATVWEQRSTCNRNSVGAVISLQGRHIGSGYNGPPAGMPHCDHPVTTVTFARLNVSPLPPLPASSYDRGCREAIHAEANALAYCARHGVAIEGGTIYTTLSPCYSCSQLIIAAGLVRVVFNRSYRDPAGIDLLRNSGLIVDKIGTR